MKNEINKNNNFDTEFEQFVENVITQKILPSLIAQNQKSAFDFMSCFSKSTDQFILQAERDENLNFITGHATLNYLEDNTMQVSFDFYFQNSQGAWINKKSSTSTFNVDEHLNAQAKLALIENKSLKFDIDKPTEQ